MAKNGEKVTFWPAVVKCLPKHSGKPEPRHDEMINASSQQTS